MLGGGTFIFPEKSSFRWSAVDREDQQVLGSMERVTVYFFASKYY